MDLKKANVFIVDVTSKFKEYFRIWWEVISYYSTMLSNKMGFVPWSNQVYLWEKVLNLTPMDKNYSRVKFTDGSTINGTRHAILVSSILDKLPGEYIFQTRNRIAIFLE